MAIKNKNIKSINRKNTGLKQSVLEEKPVVTEVQVDKEEESVVEEHTVKNDIDTIKNEMLSLKMALLSVYNKLHVYATRNYINYKNHNFSETDTLLGFKHKEEKITIKSELLDIEGNLYKGEKITVNIKKNNKDFNDFVLLEKTKLEDCACVVFQTKQTESCTFQICFTIHLENNEKINYNKEISYIACNKVEIGYFDRHSKKYQIIESPDIVPSLTCRGNTYEIKLYKLPLTDNNHGERVCLYIPEDIYASDGGNYSFMYNNFQMPLFFEKKITLNNEPYYVFLSTSYYENSDNILYDFSIKIDVI